MIAFTLDPPLETPLLTETLRQFGERHERYGAMPSHSSLVEVAYWHAFTESVRAQWIERYDWIRSQKLSCRTDGMDP
jgi:hypothetical protein